MKGETIDIKSKVEAIFTYKWASLVGEHWENYFCNINVWRDLDLLPDKLKDNLIGKKSGDCFEVLFKQGEVFPYSKENIIDIDRTQFLPPKSFKTIEPHAGRFYPLGFFRKLKGVFSTSIQPIRLVGIDNYSHKLTIDTNIPIAKYDLSLNILIKDVIQKSSGIGGECKDWYAVSLENGPGMQVRFDGFPTDFEFDNPESFQREDETDDKMFYEQPRITTHIDAVCNKNLVELYNYILPQDGKVLDLMSSVQSHFPENKNYYVTGLGLNIEEMRQNVVLKEYLIQDLNKNPFLPFKDEDFDIVVCDLSIEYVIKPFELIKEIKRILKTCGIVTFSFSNRYFPPKVIKLWVDLHEFERMGYILEILLMDGGFKNFKTYSYRGYPRPYYDKYFRHILFSDPLYVVYAQKA